MYVNERVSSCVSCSILSLPISMMGHRVVLGSGRREQTYMFMYAQLSTKNHSWLCRRIYMYMNHRIVCQSLRREHGWGRGSSTQWPGLLVTQICIAEWKTGAYIHVYVCTFTCIWITESYFGVEDGSMDEEMEAALENTLYGQHAVFGLIEFMLGPTKTPVCIYCALMSICICVYACVFINSFTKIQEHSISCALLSVCKNVYILHIHQWIINAPPRHSILESLGRILVDYQARAL